MQSAQTVGPKLPTLNKRDYQLIADFVEQDFGIRMPPAKLSLVQGRLAKRVVATGFASFGDYFRHVIETAGSGDEILYFTDLVSTHETNFFREEGHFNFLVQTVLPELARHKDGRPLRVLSAACSTGEEAYTLAMTVENFIDGTKPRCPGFDVEGFDLSDRAINIASRAVYTAEKAARIPAELHLKYLMRSKNQERRLYRFVPELRERCRFHTGNLFGDPGLLSHQYDVIFCRNVLIYFDKPHQKKVINLLRSIISPEGFLFLGHAESLSGIDAGIRPVSSAVFQIK